MHRSLGSEVLTDYARHLIRQQARQLAHCVEFDWFDKEDISQELTMHLLNQASRFDPGRAAPSTFANVVIESGVQMLLRKQNRQLRRLPEGKEIESLEATVELPDEPAASLEALVSIEDVQRRTRSYTPSECEMLEEQEAFDLAYSKLPEDLQRLCNELMSVPPAVAARNLGISRNKMNAALETIRTHFTSVGFCRH